MSLIRYLRGRLLFTILIAMGVGSVQAATQADDFFGLTNVWTVEFQMGSKAWKDLLDFRSGVVPADSSPSKRHPGFNFFHADLLIGTTMVKNVGIRVKGSGTRAAVMPSGYPFRVQFDEFSQGTRFKGLKELSFNNNFYDSSFMRDALSDQLLREFGVPAPRTAFSKVYAKLDNQPERQFLGLYTVAEDVNKEFLKRSFDDSSGLLLKPQWQGVAKKGRVWQYQSWERGEGNESGRNHMLDLFEFMKMPADAGDGEKLAGLVDVEGYLRFVAAHAVLVNLDSYLGMGKNYYIYQPKNGPMEWIAWDQDLSFGGFFLCGTPDDRIHFSVEKPSTISDPLIRKLLGVPAFRDKYHQLVREFLDKPLQETKVLAQIDQIHAAIKTAVMEQNVISDEDFEFSVDGSAGRMHGSGRSRHHIIEPGLKYFVHERRKSVEKQLEGSEQGMRPSFGMEAQPW